ncbi:metallophosphoesterase family protein [Chthonobacter albigriseus]|uniref:metallophosphoesterase family protein n=1 Tax=Chthonobacter albigriseus TaxID=1683161 RepID=UPI0015EE55A5|nr:metallophosphoesterase [Chthonobacter albigriseus]
MRRIAHISDLHFGRVDHGVVESLRDELNRHLPDLVIISGDFTQRAKRSEYMEARAFVDSLKAPWFAVPGNHDITFHHLYQRFFDPWRRYRRFIHHEVEPVFQDEELFIVGINTARRMFLELDWSHGRISGDQIARVERQLSEAPSHLFKIVVGHHPFLPPPYAPATRVVGHADRALASFERHGVRLALAGHLHRGYLRVVDPAISSEPAAAPSRDRDRAPDRPPLVVVQTASATSTRLRDEPNAYQRICIENGKAVISSRVWDGQSFVEMMEVNADEEKNLAAGTPEGTLRPETIETAGSEDLALSPENAERGA